MARNKVAPGFGDTGGKQPDSSVFDSVIDRVNTSLNEQLMQLFDGMVTCATGKLVELEKQQFKCQSLEASDRQARERESIRYLLNNASAVSAAFFKSFNEQLWPSVDATDASEPDELSLVSHDEMEEMVAITTMHAHALNDFGGAISDLCTRIEYLEIKDASIFACEAVNPKGISEAYQRTLNQLQMGTEVNLQLFKLFDEEVIQKLESVYDDLNQIFIDADVMPEIVHTSHDPEELDEECEMVSGAATYYDPHDKVHTDFIPRSQGELNAIVSHFTKGDITVPMEGVGGGSLPEEGTALPASFYKDPAVQNIDGKKYYQRKDVVRSLNRLQKQILQQGKKSSLNTTEDIKRCLIEDIGRNHGGVAKEVSVLDERNIDFVGMIFNAINGDNSISEVVSELVNLLHIPVIKVALNDERLFQDQAHPTRKVLDLIPEAGRGVTDTKDKLYDKIERVVKGILADSDVDVESFYKAVEALHRIIHIEERASVNNEQEEKRSVIKAHARTVVVAELRKYSIGRSVPKQVQPLILKYWPTLMVNRYIRYGNEDERWRQSSQLCRMIFDLLQPVRQKAQLQELNDQYEALIEAVADALYETKQDKAEIDAQLIALRSVFEKRIAQSEHLLHEPAQAKQTEIDPVVQQEMDAYDAAMARIKDEEESVLEKVARLPTYVKPGTWFEIYTGEDRPVRRLKMSVILIETAKIVFVDRKGIKGIEKDAGEFADELSNDMSRVIADHSTFDHALGNVISMMAA